MDSLTPFVRHAPEASGALASPPLGRTPAQAAPRPGEPAIPPSQPDGPGVRLPPPPAPQTPHPEPGARPECRVPVTDGTPIPSRQRNAAAYLAGRSPGVMAFYAPGCAGAAIPTLESDETVQRLVEWREEAPYG